MGGAGHGHAWRRRGTRRWSSAISHAGGVAGAGRIRRNQAMVNAGAGVCLAFIPMTLCLRAAHVHLGASQTVRGLWTHGKLRT
jgi:hypothetical protein